MNQNRKIYQARFDKVLRFIDEHLYEPLTVEVLADAAFFSKFHFHRQFSAYVGLSVSKYVQLLRLKRASYQLAFRDNLQVIDIAYDAKFENPESFSRAFKKAFGQTPSQFRKAPKWQPWHEKYKIPVREGVIIMAHEIEVNIVGFEAVKVAALEHRKSPDLVNESVAEMIAWRKETGLSPIQTSRTFGLAYDDPKSCNPESFRFDLCAEVKQDIPENSYGLKNKNIPAGKCAHIQHVGAYEQMSEKVRFLYGDWLAESGEELRDFSCFFHYIKKLADVPENECVTDIYLPLK
ncbi:MAG TPA: helix-turn-helix domain-containing protein [Ghiorsea sp.]|nr:helix-turn-helix domain-containing protein [Ghiorsea sp.]